jgi:hypothetical protein
MIDPWTAYRDAGSVHIPITIEGIKGVLAGGPGRGGIVWDLSIDKYHQGVLIFTENGFRYHSQKGNRFEDLVDYFVDVVVTWYG